MTKLNASKAFNVNSLLNLHAFKRAKPREVFERDANLLHDGLTYPSYWSYEDFPYPNPTSPKHNLLLSGRGFADSTDRPVPVLTGGNLEAFWLETHSAASNRYEPSWMIRPDSGFFPASDLAQAIASPSPDDDARVIKALFRGDDEIRLSAFDDVAYGYDGIDKIYGYAGRDRLEGGDGPDLLDGGSGADVLIGGSGSDTFVVDNIKDQILDPDPDSTVWATIGWRMGQSQQRLVLMGDQAISGEGNRSSNVIEGNQANNQLYGGGGGDVITGHGGDDQIYGIGSQDASLGRGTIDLLTGGDGKDLFVLGVRSGVCYTDGSLQSPGSNDYAIIKDFSRDDRMQLKGKSSDYFLNFSPASQGLQACYFLFRNDSAGPQCNPKAWDRNDDLIGQIFLSDPGLKLNLTNTAQFGFV